MVHISTEDGDGWTILALDRATREWTITQRNRQMESAQIAIELMYEDEK